MYYDHRNYMKRKIFVNFECRVFREAVVYYSSRSVSHHNQLVKFVLLSPFVNIFIAAKYW